MSQPVKLSDVWCWMREIAAACDGTLHCGSGGVLGTDWKVGRGLLKGHQMMVLGRETLADSIRERLEGADTPQGRQRVMDYLATEPFPHFFAHPEEKDLLIRAEANGQKTTGRFVNREFVAAKRGRKTSAA